MSELQKILDSKDQGPWGNFLALFGIAQDSDRVEQRIKNHITAVADDKAEWYAGTDYKKAYRYKENGWDMESYRHPLLRCYTQPSSHAEQVVEMYRAAGRYDRMLDFVKEITGGGATYKEKYDIEERESRTRIQGGFTFSYTEGVLGNALTNEDIAHLVPLVIQQGGEKMWKTLHNLMSYQDTAAGLYDAPELRGAVTAAIAKACRDGLLAGQEQDAVRQFGTAEIIRAATPAHLEVFQLYAGPGVKPERIKDRSGNPYYISSDGHLVFDPLKPEQPAQFVRTKVPDSFFYYPSDHELVRTVVGPVKEKPGELTQAWLDKEKPFSAIYYDPAAREVAVPGYTAQLL